MTSSEIEELDSKLKDNGMIPISGYIHGNPLQYHVGVTDLDKFNDWLEMKLCEVSRLNDRANGASTGLNFKADLHIWVTERFKAFDAISQKYKQVSLDEYFDWIILNHLVISRDKLILELDGNDKSETYEIHLAQSSAFCEALVNLVAAVFLEKTSNSLIQRLKNKIIEKRESAFFPPKSWY